MASPILLTMKLQIKFILSDVWGFPSKRSNLLLKSMIYCDGKAKPLEM